MRKPSTHNLIIICIGICLIIISYLVLSFQMYTPSYQEIYKVADSTRGIGKHLSPKVVEITEKIILETNNVNRVRIYTMKIELLISLISLVLLNVFYVKWCIGNRFNENEQRSFENHKSTQMLVMKGRMDV